MNGFASMMEWFQLIVALVGLLFGLWRLWVVIETALEVTDSPPEDLRRLIARITLRGQLARVAVQAILFYIGIVSVLLPPPPPGEGLIELEQGNLVRFGLVLITILKTADSLFESRQRSDYERRVQSHIAATQVRSVAILVDGKTTARGDMEVNPEPVNPPHVLHYTHDTSASEP